MRRTALGRAVILAGAVALLTVLAGPTAHPRSAHGQDDSVPFDPENCKTDPRPGSFLEQVAATPIASPVPLSDPALWAAWRDHTEGIPADEPLEAALTETFDELFACSNGGDPLRAYALVTDDYIRRRPPTAAGLEALRKPAAVLPEDDWVGLTVIGDLRYHGDDRAVAFIRVWDPTLCDKDVTLVLVFLRTADRWLVDDLARLDGESPVGYDRYDPPVLRRTDDTPCANHGATPAAATPTAAFRLSYDLPARGGLAEITTMTAQEVVDTLWRDNGEIRLEDAEERSGARPRVGERRRGHLERRHRQFLRHGRVQTCVKHVLAGREHSVYVTFEDWTQGRPVSSWGTNAGAQELPFQTWRHFKEAFAPELVARAIAQSELPVRRGLPYTPGRGSIRPGR